MRWVRYHSGVNEMNTADAERDQLVAARLADATKSIWAAIVLTQPIGQATITSAERSDLLRAFGPIEAMAMRLDRDAAELRVRGS